MKPAYIDYCEEGILSPEYMPEYMRNSRYFRIEYIDPASGYSNCEGKLYLNKNDPHIYDRLDKIKQILSESYGSKS